jgi:hypothetical protein
MKNRSQIDPIKSHARKTVAARRVGENARCECGENRPLALVTGSKPVICAACQRRQQGKPVFDLHHVAGRKNSALTLPVHTNEHRAVLSAAQYDWPESTLRNPSGNELLKAAGSVRGVMDYLDYLNRGLLRPVAERLELLGQEKKRGRKKK